MERAVEATGADISDFESRDNIRLRSRMIAPVIAAWVRGVEPLLPGPCSGKYYRFLHKEFGDGGADIYPFSVWTSAKEAIA